MTRVAQVLAALEALTLLVVGALETFFFREPALYAIFLIEPDEYDAVALWTRNVGVYNMLMGVTVIVGVLLARGTRVEAGRALVLAISAMHVVLGVSLVITAPELWLSAIFEAGLALAVILAVLLGRRPAARRPTTVTAADA
ncbi:DUF1304 family protein [Agromyces binzhouensis]|uniref:DUF1304 family protein n=1 Tax=Agromyces binzhouensis TaxID=1817495 RepID=UPI00363BD6F2